MQDRLLAQEKHATDASDAAAASNAHTNPNSPTPTNATEEKIQAIRASLIQRSEVEEETISHLGIIDYRYMVGEIRFIIPKVMYRVRTLREGRRRCWGFTMICGWKITGKNSSFSFISI